MSAELDNLKSQIRELRSLLDSLESKAQNLVESDQHEAIEGLQSHLEGRSFKVDDLQVFASDVMDEAQQAFEAIRTSLKKLF